MDDRKTFEHEIAAVIQRAVGPPRPIDAMRVARAAAAAPSPRWTLRSVLGATRLVAAGAVVALFGGILLAGALTMQSDDDPAPIVGASASAGPTAEARSDGAQTAEGLDATTRSDILPGVDLVVEAIDPGVYRVEGDGMRTLGSLDRMVFGRDGSVRLAISGILAKLGQQEPLRHSGLSGVLRDDPDVQANVQVAGDGTVWLVSWDRGAPRRTTLWSNDGDGWERHPEVSRLGLQIRALADGDVWARLDEGPLRRWHQGRWEQRVPDLPVPAGTSGPNIKSWHVSDDGSAWVHNRRELQRFDGRSWQTVASAASRTIEVTPGGDVFRIDEGHRAERLLEDGSWAAPVPAEARWSAGDFDPGDAFGDLSGDRNVIGVAPDGALWRSANILAQCDGHDGCTALGDLFPERDDIAAVGACGGVDRHVGATVTTHLSGHCIWDIDFDAHGNAWLEASLPTVVGTHRSAGGLEVDELSFGPRAIYVITPEAIAAAG